MKKDVWTVAEAKAKLNELIERARSVGPQMVTKKGKTVVVIVSAEEWQRKTERKDTLAEFFLRSPLRNSGPMIRRRHDRPRRIEL